MGEMEVRPIRSGEGDRLRELRLCALREDPYAFSASYEATKDYPAEVWEELAEQSESPESVPCSWLWRTASGSAWLGAFWSTVTRIAPVCGECGSHQVHADVGSGATSSRP
jgi:hypothetical protein